jgi:hypothetical protein
MHTKKHNKRKYNKRTLSKTFGGGLSDEKPAYIKYTLLMLGISTCYMALKLTKG